MYIHVAKALTNASNQTIPELATKTCDEELGLVSIGPPTLGEHFATILGDYPLHQVVSLRVHLPVVGHHKGDKDRQGSTSVPVLLLLVDVKQRGILGHLLLGHLLDAWGRGMGLGVNTVGHGGCSSGTRS